MQNVTEKNLNKIFNLFKITIADNLSQVIFAFVFVRPVG